MDNSILNLHCNKIVLNRQVSLTGTPDTARPQSSTSPKSRNRRASCSSIDELKNNSMKGKSNVIIETEQIYSNLSIKASESAGFNEGRISRNLTSFNSFTSAKTDLNNDYYQRTVKCRYITRQTAKSIVRSLIVDIDVKKLLFSDHLMTNAADGKEVGEFRVNVGYGSYQGDKLYNVSADSHGTVDGVACGTSIRAYIDTSLRTINQTHTEYVKLPNHEMERITTIKQNSDKSFTITKSTIQGEDKQTSTKTYSEQQMYGFIGEGSNILLLRLMIKVGLRNSVRFLTMDSNADLCNSSYRPLPRRQHVINKNENFDVYGIERHIDTDIPTAWMNFFMSDGHLASRVQVGSPIVMSLCEVPTDLLHDDKIEKPTFTKKELSIEDDMQLNSMFLERKLELKNDYSAYMNKHPEINSLLSDFVQHLLMKKPECCIDEARQYFMAFDRTTTDGCHQLHSDSQLVEDQPTIKNKIKDLMRILS